MEMAALAVAAPHGHSPRGQGHRISVNGEAFQTPWARGYLDSASLTEQLGCDNKPCPETAAKGGTRTAACDSGPSRPGGGRETWLGEEMDGESLKAARYGAGEGTAGRTTQT